MIPTTTPTPANPEASEPQPVWTPEEVVARLRARVKDLAPSLHPASIAEQVLAGEAANTISHLQARLEAAERERDEAIAHDRQPYPTAAAYEAVCVALRKHKTDLAIAEARAKALRAEVDAWREAVSDGAYVVKTEHESFTGQVSFTEKTQAAIDRLQAARDATNSLPKGDDNG